MTIKDLIRITDLRPMAYAKQQLQPAWAFAKRPALQFLYLIDLGRVNAYTDCYVNFLESAPDIEEPGVFVKFWLDNVAERYQQQAKYFQYLADDPLNWKAAEQAKPKQYVYHAALAAGYRDVLKRATQMGFTVDITNASVTFAPIAKFIHRQIGYLKSGIKTKSSSADREIS